MFRNIKVVPLLHFLDQVMLPPTPPSKITSEGNVSCKHFLFQISSSLTIIRNFLAVLDCQSQFCGNVREPIVNEITWHGYQSEMMQQVFKCKSEKKVFKCKD